MVRSAAFAGRKRQDFSSAAIRRHICSRARCIWVWPLIERGEQGSLPNGILYLKGGDLAEELALTGKRWYIYDIPRFFEEDFFETKKVVYTPKK